MCGKKRKKETVLYGAQNRLEPAFDTNRKKWCQVQMKGRIEQHVWYYLRKIAAFLLQWEFGMMKHLIAAKHKLNEQNNDIVSRNRYQLLYKISEPFANSSLNFLRAMLTSYLMLLMRTRWNIWFLKIMFLHSLEYMYVIFCHFQGYVLSSFNIDARNHLHWPLHTWISKRHIK